MRLANWILGVVMVGCGAEGDPAAGGTDDGGRTAADAAPGDADGGAEAPDLGPRCAPGSQPCADGQVCTLLSRCAEPNPPEITRVSLRRGEGVLFIRAEVADGERDAETLHVALGDTVLEQGLSLTVAPSVPVERLWLTPATADTAEVWATDRTGLASARRRVPVEVIPAVAPGDACDPSAFASRCARGAVCLADGDVGRCHTAEVHLWPWGQTFMLDVTANAEPALEAGTFTAGDRLVSPMGTDQARPRWRFTGTSYVEGGPLEIRQNGHLVAVVAVEAPPVRAVGSVCDPERLADACAAGSACLEARCRPVQPPELIELSAYWRGGALGIRATGRDPDRDLEAVRIEGLGESPLAVLGDGVTSGGVQWAGAEFAAFWSTATGGRQPREVTVTLIDAEGLASEARTVPVDDSGPEPVVGSGRCDEVGLLFACEAGRTCSRTDADPEARCRTADPACPGATPLVDRIEATLEDAPDHTEVSCGDGWGPDARHVFTAPAAGRYRFTLTPEFFYAYLALRPSCTHRAERACVRALEESAVAEVDLAAGEAVTAVVELAICRCNPGPYTLEVERVE